MKARLKITSTRELEGDFEGDTIGEIVATAEMESRTASETLDQDIEILSCDDPSVELGIWDFPIDGDEDEEHDED
jgi:hypothetical protein